MPWDARFDRPIKLPSGSLIHTLRQAAEHIMALPKSESRKEPWQHAMEILLEAAEGRNPIVFAQIAVNRALSTGAEPKYGPGKAIGPEMKFHRRRRRLARDR
jgi:hypothetical protein